MPSVFSQEWRDCLRAHYTYVVRMGDESTEKSLRGVMFEAGFAEDEVKQLYVLATAHVDDVGENFVPDREFLESVALPEVEQQPAVEIVILEEMVPEIAEVEEPAAEDVQAEQADDEPPQDDPGAMQLSLF